VTTTLLGWATIVYFPFAYMQTHDRLLFRGSIFLVTALRTAAIVLALVPQRWMAAADAAVRRRLGSRAAPTPG
jgi:hypothetical protein